MLSGKSRYPALAVISLIACGVLFTACSNGPQAQSTNVAQALAGAWVPAKSIDFASKHNVLIKSADGTLTPMDVPYYRSKLIAPGTWQIESDGDFHYLIEGDSEALAIDTGYGAGNLREYLQTLTQKPVRYVANTHDHFDHTANNAYFDRAYMSAETAKKATTPYPSFAGVNFPNDYPKVIVGDGFKFQLGNREVEVLLIPNHTAGGTAYLDKRERILFSGDEFMGPNMTLNVSVAQFAGNMRKLAARRSEFDRMAGGPGIFDAADVDKYLANAEYILAGHEGATYTPQPRPSADSTAASSTQVVYNRRLVRAPDRAPGMGQPNENLRRMTYAERNINYDLRRVQN